MNSKLAIGENKTDKNTSYHYTLEVFKLFARNDFIIEVFTDL